MMTEGVGVARTSGSAMDEVRRRLRFRLRGEGTSSRNGLVDLEARVRMHRNQKPIANENLKLFLLLFSFVFFLCLSVQAYYGQHSAIHGGVRMFRIINIFVNIR